MGAFLVFGVLIWGPLVALIRAATSMPFVWAEVLGTLGWSVLLSWMSWVDRKTWTSGRNFRNVGALLGLGVGVLTTWILWGHGFSGMPSVGGGDSGNHVVILKNFISTQPQTSMGFTGFHTLSALISQLFGLSVFEAFRAVLYFSWLGFVVAWLADGSRREGFRPLGERLLFVVFVVAGFYWVFGPTFAYLQADGFFYHWLSIALMAAGLRVYAQASHWSMRLLVFCTLIVGMRGTYGLNLADLFVGLVFVFGQIALSQPSQRFRAVFFGGAVLSMAGAVFGYLQLWPLIGAPGAISMGRFQESIKSMVLTGCFLMGVSWLDRGKKATRERVELSRLVSVAAVLILVPGVIAALIWASALPKNYYFLKYPILPQTIGLFTLFVLAREHHQTRIRIATTVMIFINIGLLASPARSWYPAFRERIFRHTPSVHNVALSDVRLESWIASQLKANSCEFAGYLTGEWPRYSWMNAVFGLPEYDHFVHRTWVSVKRGCVFFEAPIENEEKIRKNLVPFVVDCSTSLPQMGGKVCNALLEKGL